MNDLKGKIKAAVGRVKPGPNRLRWWSWSSVDGRTVTVRPHASDDAAFWAHAMLRFSDARWIGRTSRAVRETVVREHLARTYAAVVVSE